MRAQLKLAAVYEAGPETMFPVGSDFAKSFQYADALVFENKSYYKNVSFGSYHMLAAEQDNAEGCFFVANAYQFGHGTSVDLKVTVDP